MTHNGTGQKVAAQEELTTTAKVTHFTTTGEADLVVSERSGSQLVMRPVDPKDHEFGRGYPIREVSPLRHRRSLVFVKNKEGSRLGDYLVVRDEMEGEEISQMNLHLLARDLGVDGGVIAASGQMDQDMKVVLSGGRAEVRNWHYSDEWMQGPTEYALRKGESQAAWKTRLVGVMKEHGVASLPLPGWKPSWGDPKSEESLAWQRQIADTDGGALMQPPFWKESWMYGEYQKWIRVELEPGRDCIWVLYPFRKGSEAPTITISEGTVRVSLGSEEDLVVFDGGSGISLGRGGVVTKLTK